MKNRINRQSNAIYFRKKYNKMSSFHWKKNIQDSIKDGVIITATTTGVFFTLKATNTSQKASLDATTFMKPAGEICGRVLVKDYAVYKKWINE